MAEEERRARETPPDDLRLAKVWEYWNEYPTALLPEIKQSLLMSPDPPWLLRPDDEDAQMRQARETWRSLGHLSPDHWLSTERAVTWHRLKDVAATTDRLHGRLIDEQLQFQSPFRHAAGRIAMRRVQEELAVTHPGLLKEQSPRLEQIARVERRYHAYLAAREKARKLVCREIEKVVPPGAELPWAGRAPPGWTSRADIPRACLVAAMRTLGLCPDDLWQDCQRQDVPALTTNQRRRFDAILARGRGLRRRSTLPFRVWLTDNAPLIDEFQLEKPAVRSAAERKGIPIPDAESDSSKWPEAIKFKRGRPQGKRKPNEARLLGVLSPKPRFCDFFPSPPLKSRI